MNVIISSASYCLPESILRQVASLEEERLRTKHNLTYLLHVCSPFYDIVTLCEELAKKHSWIQLVNHRENVGLAKTWNDSLVKGYKELKGDIVILANDDIVFREGSIDTLVPQLIESFDKGYAISCTGGDHGILGKDKPLSFSCFTYNPSNFETIGFFDEQFWPTYCEDSDFAWRMENLGLLEGPYISANLYHEGSKSVKDSSPRGKRIASRNGLTHQGNHAYLKYKWGSTQKCLYKTPFNDPNISNYHPTNLRIREDLPEMKKLEYEMVTRFERLYSNL